MEMILVIKIEGNARSFTTTKMEGEKMERPFVSDQVECCPTCGAMWSGGDEGPTMEENKDGSWNIDCVCGEKFYTFAKETGNETGEW